MCALHKQRLSVNYSLLVTQSFLWVAANRVNVLWIQVNVDIVDAGPGRGRIVVANGTMRRGDLVAAIPVDICFVIEGLDVNTTWGVSLLFDGW